MSDCSHAGRKGEGENRPSYYCIITTRNLEDCTDLRLPGQQHSQLLSVVALYHTCLHPITNKVSSFNTSCILKMNEQMKMTLDSRFVTGFHPQPSRSRSETCGPPTDPQLPGLRHFSAQHQPGGHLSDGRKAGTKHHRGHAIGGIPDQPFGL